MKAASQDALPPAVLRTAADWLVRLHAGGATDADRIAVQRWCEQHPDHACAWERAQQFLAHFEQIPVAIGRAALAAPASPSRRQAVTQLALLLAVAPAAWASWRYVPWREWQADHRTDTGEQRRLSLDDGSRLMLNTGTAITLAFSASHRDITLIAGELFVATAADDSRPLRVFGRHGVAQTHDGEFSLRQFEQHSRVVVSAGTVRVVPRTAPERGRTIAAGEQNDFDTRQLAMPTPISASSQSWTQGMLVARQMRLAELVAELARYRPGLLRCDPAVADLRISGAFPVTDIPLSLKMLGDTLPVRIHAVTRYWTTVGPVG